MNREVLNKRIDNLIEIRKNLWTAFIVLTGGTAGLLLSINFIHNINTYMKAGLFMTGFLADCFLINNISSCNIKIAKLFNKLEKGE
ncbi:MAG: hypothetical protein V2B14_02795 [bacterium]